jgi:hypothetical protein
MTMDDDARHGDRQPAARPTRRQLAIGTVGLAAVLGGGAYLLTPQLVDRQHNVAAPDSVRLAPVTPAQATAESVPFVSSGGSASPSTSVPASASGSLAESPSPSRSPDSAAVRRQIDQARAAAAKAGHPLQRQLITKGELPASAGLTTRMERTANGTLRITSAKGDLTGREDQVLAADDGTPVGDVRCTQNFHFANNATPRKIATMMLCWRTSATRSVLTLGVTRQGPPSPSMYTPVIDREWAKLR